MNDRKRATPPIFQLGFNKCGSRTLFHFFKDNGVPSVHYDSGRLATSIYRHFSNNKSLLHPRYDKTVFFSDMENIYHREKPVYIPLLLFKQLEQRYPRARFILNTRPLEDWIRSRVAHDNGNYLHIIAKRTGQTKKEVIEMWREEWNRHHQEVLSYFNGPRRRKLIVFDISTDSPRRLTQYFKDWFYLDPSLYGHKGKTKNHYTEGADQLLTSLKTDDVLTISEDKNQNDKDDASTKMIENMLSSPFIRKHLTALE